MCFPTFSEELKTDKMWRTGRKSVNKIMQLMLLNIKGLSFAVLDEKDFKKYF